ncbi:polysaccharide pyruvyl transferase CsaB [Halobacillus fulvus]|nr:polysaccharide pyruvyl transferase CsaB [Halobacillus fulvus]
MTFIDEGDGSSSFSHQIAEEVKQVHIVLSGYYGFHNAGDEAILLSMIQQLRKKNPEVRLTALSNDPVHTSRTYGIEAVNRWDLRQVFRLLSRSDGLISGGGSLLQDATGIKSIIYYTGVIRMAKLLRKPVFVYAQGMGPIDSRFGRFLVKAALKKKVRLTVRDEESRDLLERIGIRQPIELVPDPVLGMEIEGGQSDWLQKHSLSSVVTVSVRNWPTPYAPFEKVARVLDHLADRGHSIVYVPMHGQEDDAASREVAALMEQASSVFPFDETVEEKARVIGASRLLIGMRLHSLIFAAGASVPFVALSYDPKIDSFSRMSGQKVGGHVAQDDWDEESLLADVAESFEREYEEKDWVAETGKTAEMALRYFERGAGG